MSDHWPADAPKAVLRPIPQQESAPKKNGVTIPAQIVKAAGKHPLLKGFLTTAAGFSGKITEPGAQAETVPPYAMFIYCIRGFGWCDIGGRLHTVSQGDLVMVPPQTRYTCGGRVSDPWRLYWAHATGALVPEYLNALGCGAEGSVLRVGEDPEVVRLFNEIIRSFDDGMGMAELLLASHALAHLLAVLMEKRQGSMVADIDATQKIAEAIIYMNEHLDEPVRVSALARLTSFSPAYFSGLFKNQTGCAPRDYLHLLRIHRACHLLRTTGLSIKQIAAQIGYQDQFHFSRQFKAFHDLSPTEYRASRRG